MIEHISEAEHQKTIQLRATRPIGQDMRSNRGLYPRCKDRPSRDQRSSTDSVDLVATTDSGMPHLRGLGCNLLSVPRGRL